LNLFLFDYDLTFMVFFLNVEDKVYARYGQRDARDPDALQSLKGLEATMQSVLQMHARDKKMQEFAPRSNKEKVTIREIGNRRRGCYHCHNVREVLNRNLKTAGTWTRDLAYRYPPTENIGLTLAVNHGSRVEMVQAGSVAAKAGLKKGDILKRLGEVPIHSIADAQHALDLTAQTGPLPAAWTRDGKPMSGKLTLKEGWRKSDLSWRPSLRRLVPSLPFRGSDLTQVEKKALGLKPNQLAVRQRRVVNSQAEEAGVKPGDVLVGVNQDLVDLDADRLRGYVRRQFLVGDKVQLVLLRNGKRLTLPITLER
jgi:membrane-associated protease RseP (regulator of RpoE activity)